MNETLCWICSVPGTRGCSWDREFIPVDGWTATPTRIWQSWTQDWIGSFVVHDCPLFRLETYHKNKPEAEENCPTAFCARCGRARIVAALVDEKPWCEDCLPYAW